MKHTCYVVVALLLLKFQTASAQLSSDTTRSVNLNEVVISVNKTEESKRNVTQQVQVLSATQISNSQAQSTADLIFNSGNVFVQKSQAGGGSPVIRGFESSRILLVIDGVRMNNIIYRAGHLQNSITMDNQILDRLEILFGPSSTVYGSDALGGVIHFYTKKPSFAYDQQKQNIQVNAITRYGGVNNEFNGHFDFNIGGKKFASLTSFTYSDFDDLLGGKNQNPFYSTSFGERPFYVERINNRDSLVKNTNRFLQIQSGYAQYDLLQKFAYKQNEHISHGLNLQYSNSTDIPRYDRLTDPSSAGLSFAEWYYGPQERFLVAYDLNIRNNESFFQNMHAGVNYQQIEESRHTRKFGSNNRQNRIENVDVVGVNLDIQRIVRKHTIRLGLDAQYNTLVSTAKEEDIVTGINSPLDTRYPDGDNTMLNAALYLSHTMHINDKFTLTDGIRIGFTSLNSNFVDTSFFRLPFNKADQNYPVYSGSVGLVNTPTEDLKLTLLFSTGFRAPNVDDLSKVFDSGDGAVIVPNEKLEPEKTINTELGITKLFNNTTSWENTVYFTRFIDAIVTDKFEFNGQDSIIYDGTLSEVLANQNKERAYIYGFSSNLKSQCTDNLALTLGFNYTYGRIKTDSSDYPLDHIPPFMARLQLTYSNQNFSSDFFVNYNSWKKLKDYNLNGEDNEQYATPEGMPAWFTLNFRVSYKTNKFLTLNAGIDNVFDTQYRTFASGINAPGRNLFAGIRFNY
ncbi:MAG: TonB-dependent receptor [Bacteroidetes bacterium]|nr:TonB-dependent receptor [Bacteroidota bacterium]